MKKLKSKLGFTLMELMVALLILVLLVMGIGVGMDAGLQIYREAIFESDSATMADIVNTNLGDILRYSQDIRENTDSFSDTEGNTLSPDQVGFVFTNLEYGIQDAYFYTPVLPGGASMGVLQMKNLKNAKVVELVNTGAYPNLVISNFHITYVAPGAYVEGNPVRGGYFNVSYTIYSELDDSLSREVTCVVRLLNQ